MSSWEAGASTGLHPAHTGGWRGSKDPSPVRDFGPELKPQLLPGGWLRQPGPCLLSALSTTKLLEVRDEASAKEELRYSKARG